MKQITRVSFQCQKPSKHSAQMRIVDHDGKRLYLTKQEREAFLKASVDEDREYRMLCRILHDTGCRLSEALELTSSRISMQENTVTIRSLKKRKYDRHGNKKDPQFRFIPVTASLIDLMDLTFDLRKLKQKPKTANKPLWTISRPTAWRTVKRVMARAGIKGKQATSKGLRHGYAIALLMGDKPAPIHVVKDVLGHSDTSTTEIYLQAVNEEKRKLVLQALGQG